MRLCTRLPSMPRLRRDKTASRGEKAEVMLLRTRLPSSSDYDVTRRRDKSVICDRLTGKRTLPFANLLFLRDRAPQIAGRFVSRQLPAALDRYLTALPAMSLAPVAPFLSARVVVVCTSRTMNASE